MEKITFKNFFDHYIIDPLAKDLSVPQRIFALVASIVFGALTLGIAHLRCYFINRNVSVINYRNRAENLHKLASTISKISFEALHPNRKPLPADLQRNVPKILESQFLQKYYACQLPREEDVEVPYTDPITKKTEMRLWSQLSRAEKIHVNNTGTREHNKLPEWSPEMAVDRWFFAHGQAPYLDGDPRESHGNDHCSRAAIFAGVFAYMYQKYSPDHQVNVEDISLCQLAAAGHDSGRQTEGPDVYDETSAHNTVQELRDLGIEDPVVLHDCENAVANKDSPPDGRKSLIAKCVQNADSAEFARLLMRGPRQSDEAFKSSRNYLDIYRELHAKAMKLNPENPSKAVLKEGLTFGDFVYELDVLREEMNTFIYQTHQRDFRTQAVQSGQFYETVLKAINPTEFPVLNSVLLQTWIKEGPPSIASVQKKRNFEIGEFWLSYGLERISTASLNKLSRAISIYPELAARTLCLKMEKELLSRETKEVEFLRQQTRESVEVPLLAKAYAELPDLLKNNYREAFFQKLFGSKEPLKTLRELSRTADDPLKNFYHLIKVDFLHTQLKAHLASLEQKDKPSLKQAQALRSAVNELLDEYQLLEPSTRLVEAQTTAALAFQRAAEIFIDNNRPSIAQDTLDMAARRIILDKTNPFFDLKKLFSGKSKDAFAYLPSDCGFLRKRKMRACHKTFTNEDGDPQPSFELSMELPQHVRKQLEKFVALIPEDQKSAVPAKYYKKGQKQYSSSEAIVIGNDLKLTLAPGVEIYLGNTPHYWNQYHMMRIRIDENVSPQEAQKALSKVGLPMAMMPSRQEDIRNEMLARSLAFRFPEMVYEDLPKMSPQALYDKLTKEEKHLIDEDIAASKMSLVGTDHCELVQPQIAKEAWAGGVRSVGTFINAGNSFTATAAVLKNILRTGLMSSQERFQNGILGLGCVPMRNYAAGSGNQVFTRILTEKLFTERFPLNNFPVKGQIFIMMDPQVLGRMPYSYLHDRCGLRNPQFNEKIFLAQKQKTITAFKGQERIKERIGFGSLVQKLTEEPFPLNETMFDLNVGTRYIRRMVVWDDVDRTNLMIALQREGIYDINGIPLEKVIVASKNLTPDLIDHFDSEEYPSEETEQYGIEYF